MNGEVNNGNNLESHKRAVVLFGERSIERSSASSKSNSAEPSPRNRKLQLASKGNGHVNKSRGAAHSVTTRVEMELSGAKKTVRDLAMKIEESNSRGKALGNLRKPNWRGEPEPSPNDEDNHYGEVMKELENVKQEINKLKLDMAFVLEEKLRAEKTTGTSRSRNWSCSSSGEAINKEVQEINEEEVLVGPAQMEAIDEKEAVDTKSAEEGNCYAFQVDATRKKVSEIIEENDLTKELEMKLAVTISDVNMLENELALVKEIDRRVETGTSSKTMETTTFKDEEEYSPSLLRSVTEELQAAKLELSSIKEEGFNFMASMDVIRNELNRVREETAQLESTEDKQQHLKTKLMKATSKLNAVLAAEEKANLIASNLSVTLEQLTTEAIAARKEKELICEETASIKTEISTMESEIELAEKKLETAIKELEELKLSEETALENLKTIIENTVRSRDPVSQNSSKLSISKFEYEYLVGRAAGAEEIADKKVAAAQAWVEALKAHEKELLMKAEMAERELRDQSSDEDGRVIYARKLVEGEIRKWGQNGKKHLQPEDTPLEGTFHRNAIYRTGSFSPGKRAKTPRLGPPGARHSSRSSSSSLKSRKK